MMEDVRKATSKRKKGTNDFDELVPERQQELEFVFGQIGWSTNTVCRSKKSTNNTRSAKLTAKLKARG